MTGTALENTATSPYKGNKPYIFVSYAHKNTAAVLPIVAHLQSDRYRVWYDEGIDPGTEWDENIASHVENCFCFVAFLSREYLESSNCKDELNFARELDKPRLLVYLEETELPSGMRMRLTRLQAIHMYKYTNLNDFYSKFYEFAAMQSCRELPPPPSIPAGQAGRELTIYDGKKQYSGVLIGQGFAGRVYKGYDAERKEDIVFKTYTVIDSLHIPLFTCYDLESDMLKLSSPHLCRLRSVIRGRTFAIVMDYVEGETLGQYIKRKALTLQERLTLVKQILLGLQALHQKGIFYGDVTPGNVMICDEQVILCDYSESNYNGSRYDSVTMMLYKYRSPERRPGKTVDARSDIYEAGMILDTLTLNLVSEGYAGDLYENGQQLVLTRPENLSEIQAQIFAIIEKATMGDIRKRYDSADAMLKDLEKVLAAVQ